MPTETNEAASQAIATEAKTSDATVKSSGNLTLADAAAQLLAKSAKPEKKAEAQATEQTAAPAGESPAEPNTPVEEAASAAVEQTPEEAAPAEASPEAEPEEVKPEGEPDDVLSPHSSLDPETKEKIQKRINKEVAKRKALETATAERDAKIAALEAEKAQLLQSSQTQQQQAAPATPTQGNGAGSQFNDLNSLGQYERQTKEASRWAERTIHNPAAWRTKEVENPQTGGLDTIKVTRLGDAEYTENQLHEMIVNAREIIEDVIPQRRQFIAVREQSRQAALKVLPFLNDRSTAEFQAAQTLLRDPWMQSSPHAEWFAGVYIRGLKALEAEKAAMAAKTTAAEKPKPKVPAKPASDQTAVSATASSARVPVSTDRRAALAQERAKLSAKGGITAAEAAASLIRQEQLRKSL